MFLFLWTTKHVPLNDSLSVSVCVCICVSVHTCTAQEVGGTLVVEDGHVVMAGAE